ncbi:MAG TPA: peptidylprolyl isomerase [Candidatus Saccharimonadales bacterium]|nr:peptidylprolyl isomerase [Candidatus Saccharimonadales bacterium]
MITRCSWRLAPLALAALLVPCGFIAAAEGGGPAGIDPQVQVIRPVYPVGEPVTIELDLHNVSSVPATIEGECLRPSAFSVTRSGGGGSSRARKNSREDDQQVPAGKSYTRTYDLSEHFKELREAGRYRVTWTCRSVSSRMQEIFVAEPYDPERDKVAVVDTDLGTLELVMMPQQAPLHVENFVMLARAGYFDGVTFSKLIPDLEIESGSRGGDEAATWNLQLPPEIDRSILPGRGLVGAVRRQTSMTSATQFFILLKAQAGYRGLHTFFAYVRKGDEVLDALNKIGILGDTGFGAFRPAKQVSIRKIEIRAE